MESRNHVLVTGASGVLGWRLARDLHGSGWLVDGTFRANRPDLAGIKMRQLDLRDSRSIGKLTKSAHFDLVVHSAAMTRPDDCQKDPQGAHRVNVEATLQLAELLPASTRLIFISTDLVFDGLGSLYREEDEPNPVSRYAENKIEAESLLLQRPETLTLRMAKIYAAGSPFYPCFVTWMKDRFESDQTVPLFWDQYRSPLYVGDMSRVVTALFENWPTRRLFHVGGPERMSRLELGQHFAKIMGYREKLIEPTSAASVGTAQRGQDCSLNCERLFRHLGWQTSKADEGLLQLKQDFARG